MEAGDDPNHVFPLRDVESQFLVEYKQGPEQRPLGSLSYAQVMREAYPGAVYYYTSEPYRVYRVLQREKKILVRKEAFYTTRPQALPTLVFPNLSAGNVYRAVRFRTLLVVDCGLQIREAVCGYKERRGPTELVQPYPIPFDKTGISFALERFTRNYFTTGVILTHPLLGEPSVDSELCAALMYEAFLNLAPFERQDLSFGTDRHRVDRGPVKQGQTFIAIYDSTYGSLRLAAKLLEGDLLVRTARHACELARTAALVEASSPTCRALETLAEELETAGVPLEFEPETPARIGEGRVRVLLPGSRGLHSRLNNEEFEVDKVIYSPKLQSVAYVGRCKGDEHTGGVHVAAVEWIIPIPGESRMGWFDPETGETSDEPGDTG